MEPEVYVKLGIRKRLERADYPSPNRFVGCRSDRREQLALLGFPRRHARIGPTNPFRTMKPTIGRAREIKNNLRIADAPVHVQALFETVLSLIKGASRRPKKPRPWRADAARRRAA